MPVFLMEVHTEEDESVTFPVSPMAINALSNGFARKGMEVSMEVLLPKEYAARQEQLKMDTIFHGDDLPC